MSRRRLLLIGTAACLVAAGFVVRLVLTAAPGVTEENFRRLHAGMSMDRVEAILGRPSDDQQKLVHFWRGEEGTILVAAGPHGITSGHYHGPKDDALPLAEGVHATIRRWFGLEP